MTTMGKAWRRDVTANRSNQNFLVENNKQLFRNAFKDRIRRIEFSVSKFLQEFNQFIQPILFFRVQEKKRI